jgi:hypothetical protein
MNTENKVRERWDAASSHLKGGRLPEAVEHLQAVLTIVIQRAPIPPEVMASMLFEFYSKKDSANGNAKIQKPETGEVRRPSEIGAPFFNQEVFGLDERACIFLALEVGLEDYIRRLS